MKLRLAFIFLLFVSAQLFSQTKYYIYFKDKGVASAAKLSKTSAQYLAAEKELSAAAIERRKQVMGDEYITFEDLPISSSYISQLETSGIEIENKLKWFNAVTSYLTDEQAKEIAALPFVSKLDRVRIAKRYDPIETKIVSAPQNIPTVQSTTGLNYGGSLNQNTLSDVPVVHDLGITGKGVLIGILDTGFRWKTHPALKDLKIVAERDFIQKDDVTENQAGDAGNQDSHGTNVLGLMAGFDPGNLIGPAYEASIILAKTEYVPTETRAEEDNYAAALEWMESLGVQITTSSLGYNQFDGGVGDYPWSSFDGQTTITAKAINLAFQRGVTTLTAAGNERANAWGKIITPGDAINVITVGAVDFTNKVASFSSPGPTFDGRIKPEVVAMGVTDYVSNTSGKYNYGNGTSYATPIAAGIAGLLKSAWPHLTNQQIRKIFLECGDNVVTPNNDRGWGLISAKRVISYPNLSRVNGYFRMNKIFLEPNKLDPTKVVLNYKIGTGSYKGANMQINGDIKFSYLFADLADNSSVEFYFTYKKDGVEVREPALGSYKINELNIVGNEIGELPTAISLYQNYPNPFNSSTTIRYELTDFGHVQLNLINMLGQKIRTIVDQVQSPGLHQYKLNTEDFGLSSGVYLYSLSVGNTVVTKKMLLVK
ncbi:MAG: subtilisin-like serine protease [Stygiobacter sp.]|nr:MAG: subtilisin-like serine protease [Stygiobacter sp.]KAF0215165.1 MAG: subtilisin-like serine [Ignavibacteria bacterium]